MLTLLTVYTMFVGYEKLVIVKLPFHSFTLNWNRMCQLQAASGLNRLEKNVQTTKHNETKHRFVFSLEKLFVYFFVLYDFWPSIKLASSILITLRILNTNLTILIAFYLFSSNIHFLFFHKDDSFLFNPFPNLLIHLKNTIKYIVLSRYNFCADCRMHVCDIIKLIKLFHLTIHLLLKRLDSMIFVHCSEFILKLGG